MNAIIQQQYINTNIEIFLTELSNVIDKHTTLLVSHLTNNVFNLETATGIGLDLWGALLNFPRHLPTPDKTGTINSIPFQFYNRNFYKSQFIDENINFTYMSLDDNSYKKILLCLSTKLTTDCTIPNINVFCEKLFNSFGGSSFIRDSENMEFVSYIFRFEMPQWFKYVLDNYDILPRPAGVGSRYLESISYKFGFKEQSRYSQTGKKNITNFYKSVFKKQDNIELLLHRINNFKPKQYTLISNITNIFYNANIITYKPKQEQIFINKPNMRYFIHMNLFNKNATIYNGKSKIKSYILKDKKPYNHILYKEYTWN